MSSCEHDPHPGFFTFICFSCEIYYAKHIDRQGEARVCPRCKNNRFLLTVKNTLVCFRCNKTTYRSKTTEYMDYHESLTRNSAWRTDYPIDLEALCKEAYKPERILHRLSH